MRTSAKRQCHTRIGWYLEARTAWNERDGKDTLNVLENAIEVLWCEFSDLIALKGLENSIDSDIKFGIVTSSIKYQNWNHSTKSGKVNSVIPNLV